MSIVKWELLDEFKKQDGKAEKVRSRYAKRKAELHELITHETVKLDGYIRKEALEDADMTAEKAVARKSIADAEAELEIISQEQAKANEALNTAAGRITVADLTADWVHHYSKTVREKELPQIQRQFEEGRAIILNAALDFIELRERYESIEREMRERHTNFFRGHVGERLAMSSLFSQQDVTKALISNDDLQYVKKYRKLPSGVERNSSKGRK